jgi:hypothetical protein
MSIDLATNYMNLCLYIRLYIQVGFCRYVRQALLTNISAEADLQGEDELQCKVGRKSQGTCAWNGFGASCLWLQQKASLHAFIYRKQHRHDDA